MSTAPTPRALSALCEAHGVLMAAVVSNTSPPGPLLAAAVEVADAVEAAEDEAIEGAARALGHLWPPARTRAMLRRAVKAGDVTVEEIAGWAAQTERSRLEAEAGLLALFAVIEEQEIALAGRAEQERGEGCGDGNRR